MKVEKVTISFVIPMFNEEEVIAKFLQELETFIYAQKDYNFEILLVDDGSTDNSVEAALESTKLKLIFVEMDKNRGGQFAISAGLKVAAGDYVITLDADGQHPLDVVQDFLKIVKYAPVELVQAFQPSRSQGSKLKNLFAKFFWILIYSKVRETRTRNIGDFRIMSRSLVNKINSHADPKVVRFLAPQLSTSSRFIPFAARARTLGKTKYTFSKLLNLGLDSIFQLSVRPLRVVATAAGFCMILTFMYSIYVMRQYILQNTVPGWTSLVLLTCFMGSMNLLAVCLLGEYILRIYQRTELVSKPYSIRRVE
jgi:dolichol-phosphate mannosyltransferase